MQNLPAIFALLVAAAGWYYMFYSTAAQNLQGIEDRQQNRLRVRLRRAGGLVIMLLGVAFYGMFVMLREQRAFAALLLMAVVFVLMLTIVVLGLVDIRLTSRMRRERGRRHS